jgi:hypothetical protein
MVWFTHSYELRTSARLQVWCNEAFPIPDVFHQLYISNRFICMTWKLVLQEFEELRQGINIIPFQNMRYGTESLIYVGVRMTD